MKESEQREIFKNNLNRQIARSGKMQTEIARDLGISQQRISTWTTGTALPRIGMIERLAAYFNVSKSKLIDPHTDDEPVILTTEEEDIIRAYRDAGKEIRFAVRAILKVKEEKPVKVESIEINDYVATMNGNTITVERKG